jgi:hypothetical protein
MGIMSWTERTEKRGLDPLGIQNAGVALYQSLVPGISNVTLRVRYYGYYCWVSMMYATDGATNDRKAWNNRVRRAEAAYALIAAKSGTGNGVGGTDWAGARLALNEAVIDFSGATDGGEAKQYLIQSVFNGAYYTQMLEMGLFVEGELGIQRAHNIAGISLAEAFRASIGPEIETLLHEVIKAGSVTPEELDLLAPAGPSAIPAENEERKAYEDLLFARSEFLDSEKDHSRALSMRLILDTAAAIKARPDPDDVRWHLFAASHHSDSALDAQRLLWEAYQCQDIFQVASAALLEWSAELMGDTGLSIPELIDETARRLTAVAGDVIARTWGETVANTDPAKYAFTSAWDEIVGRRGSVEEKALLAVKTMAAVAARLSARPNLNEAVRSSLQVRGNARSIVTELDWLQSRASLSMVELIPAYIAERVVRRHSWVAMQKLRRQRDYTFLFELKDGRFIRRRGYAPAQTTPRLGPAIQFLVDLGLIGPAGLTTAGAAILKAKS